ARNTGAAACDTEFLVFLDADDRLDEHYLERTVPVLASAPGSTGYVYTQCHYFGAEEGTTSFPEWDAARLLRWPFVHVSALLRGELARRHPYDERARTGVEDWDFYLTLAEAGYGGVLVDEPLLWYRKHGGESRGDRLASDPAAEHTFHQILRKHWRLGGVGHALRVEAYYARRAALRWLGPRRRSATVASRAGQ
ncbi:MAG TPA: glycosyltransferase family 2 protein, partial [Acidimicrobiales bacterium]|nr:glycosyltransferase family 2 protein [Acidimicrobiales bacterium]